MLKVSNTALEMALACLLRKGLPQETKNIFTWKFTIECEDIREGDTEPRDMNDCFKFLSYLLLKGHLVSLVILTRCFE